MAAMTPEAQMISNVSGIMARIHRVILESEISDLELKTGQPIGAHGRLQLLLHAPELAWLRAMSQMMAAIDEISFQKEPITPLQVRAIVVWVEDLFIKETNADFALQYRRLLTSTPDLMIEHSQLRAQIKKLDSLNQPQKT